MSPQSVRLRAHPRREGPRRRHATEHGGVRGKAGGGGRARGPTTSSAGHRPQAVRPLPLLRGRSRSALMRSPSYQGARLPMEKLLQRGMKTWEGLNIFPSPDRSDLPVLTYYSRRLLYQAWIRLASRARRSTGAPPISRLPPSHTRQHACASRTVLRAGAAAQHTAPASSRRR